MSKQKSVSKAILAMAKKQELVSLDDLYEELNKDFPTHKIKIALHRLWKDDKIRLSPDREVYIPTAEIEKDSKDTRLIFGQAQNEIATKLQHIAQMRAQLQEKEETLSSVEHQLFLADEALEKAAQLLVELEE